MDEFRSKRGRVAWRIAWLTIAVVFAVLWFGVWFPLSSDGAVMHDDVTGTP